MPKGIGDNEDKEGTRDPSASDAKDVSPDSPLPKNWFSDTLKAIPALRWALGVAALAVIFSVARAYAGDTLTIVTACLIIIGLAVVLVLFSTFAAKKKAKGIRVDVPIYIIIYLVIALIIVFAVFGTLSLWFGWPIPDLKIGNKDAKHVQTDSRPPSQPHGRFQNYRGPIIAAVKQPSAEDVSGAFGGQFCWHYLSTNQFTDCSNDLATCESAHAQLKEIVHGTAKCEARPETVYCLTFVYTTGGESLSCYGTDAACASGSSFTAEVSGRDPFSTPCKAYIPTSSAETNGGKETLNEHAAPDFSIQQLETHKLPARGRMEVRWDVKNKTAENLELLLDGVRIYDESRDSLAVQTPAERLSHLTSYRLDTTTDLTPSILSTDDLGSIAKGHAIVIGRNSDQTMSSIVRWPAEKRFTVSVRVVARNGPEGPCTLCSGPSMKGGYPTYFAGTCASQRDCYEDVATSECSAPGACKTVQSFE